MKKLGMVLAWAIVAALPACAAAQTFDQVWGASGTPTRGRIVRISPTEVVMNVSGAEQSFPVNELRRLAFAGEPDGLTSARKFISEQRLKDAAADLAGIDESTITNNVVKQEVEYLRAFVTAKMALAGTADKTEAGRLLAAFLRNGENSYHYFEAAELFGDLAVAAGQYDSAARHYAIVAQAPWADYKMRSAVLEGRALLAQGKPDEAQPKFQSVIDADVTSALALHQKSIAKVGLASCLATAGDPQEGIRLIEDLIANNDPLADKQLFGRAYNALGACYQKASQPKDAILAYLHVDLQFSGDAEAHAEALYHLSKLWQEEKNSDRAVRARSKLRENYPGSSWASLN
jgi:tetratricopeptide (TPR) repeat protein